LEREPAHSLLPQFGSVTWFSASQNADVAQPSVSQKRPRFTPRAFWNGAFGKVHLRITCLRPAINPFSFICLRIPDFTHPCYCLSCNNRTKCLLQESSSWVVAVSVSKPCIAVEKRTNGCPVSGLSAAHTIYLNGGNVLLLDKNSEDEQIPWILDKWLTLAPDFFGGNSTKATSGINGALTRTQVDEKIGDSVKQFYEDTLKSARDKARPDLIKVLTYQSASAVEWLQDVFNLDLTLVSRLGYG
jgi:FAD binding domain